MTVSEEAPTLSASSTPPPPHQVHTYMYLHILSACNQVLQALHNGSGNLIDVPIDTGDQTDNPMQGLKSSKKLQKRPTNSTIPLGPERSQRLGRSSGRLQGFNSFDNYSF